MAVKNAPSRSQLAEMLSTFVSHFTRAIRQEMDCMRERMGSFEVALTAGERNETNHAEGGQRCTYRIASNDEKLVAGAECTLRTPKAEYLVRIERLEGPSVTLGCGRHVELGTGEATLVIYPWFLYEKLLEVLNHIDPGRLSVERGMTLFGKLKATSQRRDLLRDHRALNASQQAAVQLCSDSDLAFVWGPPGAGKTTTLAHIVHELLVQGMRILVLSTTNAALDQVLEKIAGHSEMGEPINGGKIVRIGRTEGPAFGAALRDVAARLTMAHQKALDRMLRRRPAVDLILERCEKALETLSHAGAPFQPNLFGNEEPRSTPPNLAEIFTQHRTTELHSLGPMELAGLIRRRHARLLRVRELCAKGIEEERRNALARKEQQVVDGASLVLSTLTNAYFSPLMQEQRFDVVIVEEASMAILPALFYAACLGRRKTIVVGDPCQLPSIVHSDESYVRKVMGRNIFEVAVTAPLSSPLVAMLDVQYRMHPVIGDLVSDLFYSGRLKHGGETAICERIAALEPYAGAPLIVLDTAGRATCRPGAGQSRVNDQTGKICLDLALQAAASGAGTVAIVTPYVDQARAIRSLLKESSGGAPAIECSTVHRFQGQERDVVILDTVDADPMRPSVLLSEHGPGSTARNLVNVAISRARGKLIIVADVKYFELRAADSIITKMIRRALVSGHREVFREKLS